MFSEHAFAVYPIATQAVGAEGRAVAAKNWGTISTRWPMPSTRTPGRLCRQPQQPHRDWFDAAALGTFLARVPAHVLVVLDEAYIEYAEGQELPDGLAYLADYPNLLVSRTFSKAYGPAALRVGYAISSPVIADVLNRVRQPFNVNSGAGRRLRGAG